MAIRQHWVHSHCNRQPPGHCPELMAINQNSAFGVGDYTLLNKLFLFYLFIPNWTRKPEFWRCWPGSLWALLPFFPYESKENTNRINSNKCRNPYTQVGSICMLTWFCHFYLGKKIGTSRADLQTTFIIHINNSSEPYSVHLRDYPALSDYSCWLCWGVYRANPQATPNLKASLLQSDPQGLWFSEQPSTDSLHCL